MELKRNRLTPSKDLSILLIVPYGIETAYGDYQVCVHLLLIVPYGIETRF